MTKIAGMVVLYNPNINIVIKNIQTYIDNIDILFVVDNSDKQSTTNKLLSDKFNNIKYITNGQNLGIATALNIGCRAAMNFGYDWLLTMDQDSSFISFVSYIKCLKKIDNTDDIAILSANAHKNVTNKIKQENNTCDSIDIFSAITSGNILNLRQYEKIGGFEDKLFIDVVDFDYCIKAQNLGLRVLKFDNILLEHELGSLDKLTNLFTRKKKYKRQHSPQRLYYFIRNYLFLWSKYRKIFPKEFSASKVFFNLIIHKIIKVVIYEEQKSKKLQAIYMGCRHFIAGKYGKFNICL